MEDIPSVPSAGPFVDLPRLLNRLHWSSMSLTSINIYKEVHAAEQQEQAAGSEPSRDLWTLSHGCQPASVLIECAASNSSSRHTEPITLPTENHIVAARRSQQRSLRNHVRARPGAHRALRRGRHGSPLTRCGRAQLLHCHLRLQPCHAGRAWGDLGRGAEGAGRLRRSEGVRRKSFLRAARSMHAKHTCCRTHEIRLGRHDSMSTREGLD